MGSREPLKITDEVKVTLIGKGTPVARGMNVVEVTLEGASSGGGFTYEGKVDLIQLGMKPEDVRPTDTFRITIERIDAEKLPLDEQQSEPDHIFEAYDANPTICRHCGAVKPGPCYTGKTR